VESVRGAKARREGLLFRRRGKDTCQRPVFLQRVEARGMPAQPRQRPARPPPAAAPRAPLASPVEHRLPRAVRARAARAALAALASLASLAARTAVHAAVDDANKQHALPPGALPPPLPPTRRVQLVRGDGRDVSTFYGREGGGTAASSLIQRPPPASSPSRKSAAAVSCTAGRPRRSSRVMSGTTAVPSGSRDSASHTSSLVKTPLVKPPPVWSNPAG
jgi:hypothetical protein